MDHINRMLNIDAASNLGLDDLVVNISGAMLFKVNPKLASIMMKDERVKTAKTL